MTRERPHKGQILYRLNIGNNARHCQQVLTPVIVSKVGRKYFTVTRDGSYALESEHHIEDWSERTDYSTGYALYASEQAWADEKETIQLCEKLGENFRYGRNKTGLPLAALREIMGIVEKGRGE